MEQNNQPTQPATNQNGKVMDVQPPGGQMPGTSDVKLAPANAAPSENSNNAQMQPQQPDPKPQQPTAQSEDSIQANQPTQAIDPRKTSNKKPKGPILAVILAVIVLLGLCSLAVFLYLQDNQDSISGNETPQTSQPVASDLPADTTTPEQATDQAVEAVDKTLKDIENSSGTDEKEISDDTLGL